MRDHDPGAYAAEIGEDYTALYEDLPETGDAVERLFELAGEGRVLELGIGTGRLALPLVERGLEVHGIDYSRQMAERLRAREGAEGIDVVIGDFSEETSPRAPFALVFLAFNTIFALSSPEAQIRCFEKVAAQLEPGGRFVLEAFVIDPGDFRHGQAIQVRTMTPKRVELQLSRYDPVEQRMERVFLNVFEGRTLLHSANDTYASPRELDLMARIAGFELEDRWGDWSGVPFTETSTKHVSVYRRH